MTDVREAIREHARALGFDAAGFCAPETSAAENQALDRFLAAGRHGDMAWMATTKERRADPKALWPDVRTIIVVAMNYGPATDPLDQLRRPDRGAIAAYAKGRDYHDTMKGRLRRLARWINEAHGGDVKFFVDTAPVMEKPLAARAGLGWQGKHTNLVSRTFGSWLLLGEVFTTLDLPPDEPATDHCGSCDLCVQACPTDALTEPYQIDPRRCLSYLTIEHKGEIPADLLAPLGNRIYGCDDCIAVCPWNKYQSPTPHADFRPRAELAAPRLADLAGLDDRSFRQVFSKSPIKRTGRDRFLRNVRIAMKNGEKEIVVK